MSTATLGAFEAKNRFSELLEKASHGKETIVTKHGHPIAKIVPFRESEESTEAVFDRIAQTRLQVEQRGGVLHEGETWKDIARSGIRL
jgi:prevent-host-death family protein